MASFLEHCPTEVIAHIIELLPLHDICSLRKTSRTLATKATQKSFESFFEQRRIFLTCDSLQGLIDATKPGRLGRLLRTLTVTGVVSDTKRQEPTVRTRAQIAKQIGNKAQQDLDERVRRQAADERLRKSGLDIALLREAFSNLAGRRIPLRISLRIMVYHIDSDEMLLPTRYVSWKLIWKSAANTFNIVLEAIVASRIQIEALNVYQSDDRCSVACNEINYPAGTPEFAQLPSMKSLALSFSDRFISGIRKGRDHTKMQAEADSEGNFIGLAGLLKSCPNLVTLILHHYRLDHPALVYQHLHRERFLQRIRETAPLPHLQNLALRGLYAREEDLLALVKRSPLRVLSLENVILAIPGSFRPIFDYCASTSSKIEELCCAHLKEAGQLCSFEHLIDKPRWSNTLDRSSEEVQRTTFFHASRGPPPDDHYFLHQTGVVVKSGISYSVSQRDFVSNPFDSLWRIIQQKGGLYGPPTNLTPFTRR